MSMVERRSADSLFIERKFDHAGRTFSVIDRHASRGMLEIWHFGIEDKAIRIFRYERLICLPDLPDGGVWGKWSTRDGGWDAENLELLGFVEDDVPPEPADVVEEGMRELVNSLSFKSRRGVSL